MILLNYTEWTLNEGLTDKEKEIFLLWKQSFKISQIKTDNEASKNANDLKIENINEKIKSIIGDDENLKDFYDNIKDRVNLNKKENSLAKLKQKDDKTTEDLYRIRELKQDIKDLKTNNNTEDEDE